MGCFDIFYSNCRHFGTFWPKIEKNEILAWLWQKFEKFEILVLYEKRHINSFPKRGHTCFYHYLFSRYRIFSKFWPYRHTVHSTPRGGKNYFLDISKNFQIGWFCIIHIICYSEQSNLINLGHLGGVWALLKSAKEKNFRKSDKKYRNSTLFENSAVYVPKQQILTKMLAFFEEKSWNCQNWVRNRPLFALKTAKDTKILETSALTGHFLKQIFVKFRTAKSK